MSNTWKRHFNDWKTPLKALVLLVIFVLALNFYLSWKEQREAEEGMEEEMEMPMPPAFEEVKQPIVPEIVYENRKEIKVFQLQIQEILHEIRPGVTVRAWGFNRQVPGPEIRVQEGDTVRIIFYNNHTENHTIHWHGIPVPSNMDGVPGVSQKVVEPKQSYVYEFVARPSGTFMYHCHVDAGHHIDMGMYGAFIIEPKNEAKQWDKEFVLLLDEWNTKHVHQAGTGEGPDGIPYFSGNPKFKPQWDHFLINGKSYPATESITVRGGERVKIRLINIGLQPYSMHLHGHTFLVTHRDGYTLESPFYADTILIGPGERYDILFTANNPGDWMLHDHAGGTLNAGFEPGGMMIHIHYEGFENPILEEEMEKIEEYNRKVSRQGSEETGEQEASHESHTVE